MSETKQKTPVMPRPTWNKHRMREILHACAGKTILVVGDVGVDRYTLGTVERISPEAPVPVVSVEDEQLKLGLAANVADNIRALGGRPCLVGVVGRDRSAQDFRALLKNQKIAASYLITDPTRRTVVKERIVSERQQLLRVDYESVHPIAKEIESAILKKVRESISQADVLILQDYAKGMLSEGLAKSIFSIAKAAGKAVAVDPNAKTPVHFYRGAYVLTPNTREAERLSGIPIADEASLTRAGREILKKTAARHVVITRGKEGMAIFSSGTTSAKLIPTYVREVYDVSGAGDTVISVLALAQAAGATIEEASILGNLAAGVEVGKRGTATVTPDEVLVALEFFGAIPV